MATAWRALWRANIPIEQQAVQGRVYRDPYCPAISFADFMDAIVVDPPPDRRPSDLRHVHSDCIGCTPTTRAPTWRNTSPCAVAGLRGTCTSGFAGPYQPSSCASTTGTRRSCFRMQWRTLQPHIMPQRWLRLR